MKAIVGLIFVALGSVAVAAPKATIQDLKWMSGLWQGESQGVPTEAYASNTNGGQMIALVKMSIPTTIFFSEFQEFEETKSGSLLVRTHRRPLEGVGMEFELAE